MTLEYSLVQGYGLTETAPVLIAEDDKTHKIWFSRNPN